MALGSGESVGSAPVDDPAASRRPSPRPGPGRHRAPTGAGDERRPASRPGPGPRASVAAAAVASEPSGAAPRLRRLLRSGRDLTSLAGAGAISQLLTVVSGPLVARMVGPLGRGEIATVTLVTLLSVFVLQGGYPLAITRAIASSGAPARDVFHGRMTRGVLWCTVPAVVGAAVAWYLLRHSHHRTTLVVEAFVMVLLYAVGRLVGAMLAGEGDVRKNSVLTLVNSGGYLVLVTLAFVFFPHIPSTVIVGFFTASSAWWLVVSVRLLKPATGDSSAVSATDDMRRFARRSYFSGVSVLDGLGLDGFLVGVVLGQVALGLFSVAGSAANVPSVVLTPIAAMLLGKMAAQPTTRDAQRIMRQWLIGSVALTAAGVTLLELLIGPVIRVLFGHEYAPAVPLARLLTLAWGLLAVRKVLAAVAMAQGRAAVTSTIEVVATVSLLATAIPFLHSYGIDGAGYAMMVAAVVSCAALVFVVRWRSDAEYRVVNDPRAGELQTLATAEAGI